MAHEKQVIEAYEKLFSESCPYSATLKYSGKFKGYNARISLRLNHLTVRLSKHWRTVSKEIQLGLIQSLLARLLKRRAKSLNIDLYHLFLKRIHIAVPKTRDDPILARSFDKLNAQFFDSMLEKPNLQWGSRSIRRLGYYDFGTDTITLSKILSPEHATQELMEYVLYHELLHKKFKFEATTNRTRSHTPEFRHWEKRFPRAQQLEKELSILAFNQRKSGLNRKNHSQRLSLRNWLPW